MVNRNPNPPPRRVPNRTLRSREYLTEDEVSDLIKAARKEMPVISTFFGIVIRMYYLEHGIPHFHAEHQGQQATFTFDGQLLAGSIQSRTALRLIREWALAHTGDLEANWNYARTGDPLERIAPLD